MDILRVKNPDTGQWISIPAVQGEPGRGVPEVTTNDDGKFLRVVNGNWVADKVPNANGVSF